LLDLYKSTAVVDKIILEKIARGGDWVKAHPECPDLPEATLYLCWSGAGKRREEEQGTTTRTSGSTDHDMADPNTKIVLDKLLSRPTGPASNVPAIEGDKPGPAVVLTPKSKPITTPRTKTKIELHQASLTKTANAITSKLRALHSVLNDLNLMPTETDAQKGDVELYKAKHRLLLTGYTDTQGKVEGMLACKDRANEMELEQMAASTATVFNWQINCPCVC
jgi:hypothetical protein